MSLPWWDCPVPLLQLQRQPRVGNSHSRAPAAMLSGTRLEFSLYYFVLFTSGRQVWKSGSLKAGVPVGTRWPGSHCESQRHARLIALSPCFGVRSPGLYLLNDHLFCFSADRATMKRPQSSLFCTQASAGYVAADWHLPLVQALLLILTLPALPRPTSMHGPKPQGWGGREGGKVGSGREGGKSCFHGMITGNC